MIKQFALGLLVSYLAAFPAVAQNVQDQNTGLMRLIDDSDGYFRIRDNVVLIEGGDSIKVCHFGLTAEFFAAHAAKDAEKITHAQPNVTCVPLMAFLVNDAGGSVDSPTAFYKLVDDSEGYTSIANNIVMIESEGGVDFCHFDVTDAFFTAAGSDDPAGISKNQPSVTCVPLGAVDK